MEILLTYIHEYNKIVIQLDQQIESIFKVFDKQNETVCLLVKQINNEYTEFLRLRLEEQKEQCLKYFGPRDKKQEPQTPKARNSISTADKNGSNKLIVQNNEAEKLENFFIQQSNQQIEQLRIFSEDKITKIQKDLLNQQRKPNIDKLKYLFLKQNLFNYENSLSLKARQQFDIQKVEFVNFIDNDIDRLTAINFNYTDLIQLSQQILVEESKSIQSLAWQNQEIQNHYHLQQQLLQQQTKQLQQQQECYQSQILYQQSFQQEQPNEVPKNQEEESGFQPQQENNTNQELQQISEDNQIDQNIENDNDSNLSETMEIRASCKECCELIEKDVIQLSCYHSYHLECIIQRIQSSGQSMVRCFCNDPVSSRMIKSIIQNSHSDNCLYEEYMGRIALIVMTNSSHSFTICKKCGFFYLSEENENINGCVTCTEIESEDINREDK